MRMMSDEMIQAREDFANIEKLAQEIAADEQEHKKVISMILISRIAMTIRMIIILRI